jgi:hypothetical protein
MKKNLLAVCMFLLLLTILTPIVALPVSAKNLNLPNDADRVYYGNGGGSVDIAVLNVKVTPPTPQPPGTLPFPTGYPTSITAMRLKFMHVEMPNADQSFDFLTVFFLMRVTKQDGTLSDPAWNPFMVVTDNAEYAQFSELFYRGSLVKWNVPPNYPFSPVYPTNNVQLVEDDDLSVVRHGNSVTVELKAEQLLERPSPLIPPGNIQAKFLFPAFKLELTKADGGSTKWVDSGKLPSPTDSNYYYGSSQYSYYFEAMGFNANAVFTAQTLSSGQQLATGATSNAGLAMNLIHTYFPPVDT